MVSSLDLGQVVLLGFTFAFSSTVFAVKILEEKNESGSLSGRLAVGVLIVQDLFAVCFSLSWLEIRRRFGRYR